MDSALVGSGAMDLLYRADRVLAEQGMSLCQFPPTRFEAFEQIPRPPGTREPSYSQYFQSKINGVRFFLNHVLQQVSHLN